MAVLRRRHHQALGPAHPPSDFFSFSSYFSFSSFFHFFIYFSSCLSLFYLWPKFLSSHLVISFFFLNHDRNLQTSLDSSLDFFFYSFPPLIFAQPHSLCFFACVCMFGVDLWSCRLRVIKWVCKLYLVYVSLGVIKRVCKPRSLCFFVYVPPSPYFHISSSLTPINFRPKLY